MSPETNTRSTGPEPLWLDRHFATRFAGRFPSLALSQELSPSRERLKRCLRLWQWAALGPSLLCACAGSRHYGGLIGKRNASALISDAACRAGLPEFFAELLLSLGDASIRDIQPLPEAEAFERAIGLLLGQLPFTMPAQLAGASESFLAVSHSDVSGVISLPTSGTTGAGKRIYCSSRDLELTADFFRHGMQYMVLPGRRDHVALLMSGERPGSVGDLLLRAMEALGVRCSVPGFVPLDRDGEDAMLDRLISLAPTCLVGVPGQLLLLARHAKAPLLAQKLRSVLLSGDAVTENMRHGIAAGLDCEVFIHYGLTETGLGGAVECRGHSGCHIREADLFHEIVDEAGNPVQRGTYGEVVITTLTREAMPLLRYRTGDEGRIVPGNCACGSVFDRIQVRGRMSERVSLPGGAYLHGTDLDAALYALPFVQGYSAVLHESSGNSPVCLVLGLRFSSDAPADALPMAEQALSALEGVRVCKGKWEVPADGTAARDFLHVFMQAENRDRNNEGPPASDALRLRQAKQSIARTNEPLLPV